MTDMTGATADDREPTAPAARPAGSDRLADALRAAAELTSLGARRAALAPRLGEVRARVRALRIVLAREKADVREAESGGLRDFLERVLGSPGERLAREREDVVRAKIELDAATADLADAEAEDAAVASRIQALGDVAAAVEAARADREVRLRNRDPAARARLDELDETLAGLEAVRKEIDEAIAAASDAMDALGGVSRAIDRARALGTADVWGAGNGWMKYSELDDANAAASRAQRAIDRMNREIRDVAGVRARRRVTVPDGRIDPAARFLDVFVDDLVSDLSSQSKIASFGRGIQESRFAVVEAFGVLRERRAEIDGRMREFEAERVQIVEGR